MKTSLFTSFFVAGVLTAFISSCGRGGCTDPTAANYNSSANFDNGTCQYNGQVIFYFDLNAPNATVSINGQTGNITSNYPNSAPACGATGCATFTLPAGISYPYSATSSLGNWSGNITAVANQCVPVLLTQNTGSVTFWTGNNNSGLLPITVFIPAQNGNVGLQSTISSAYSVNSPPAVCGASGCANFNLLPGVYNYTASGGGVNWNGSVTIVADGCAGEYQLQ